MKQAKASLADVARECGVSVSTVSYILSGTTNRFSEATCARVRGTARRLHYAPNRAGQTLQAGVTRTVALFYSAPMDRAVERFLARASTFFRPRGYTIVSVPLKAGECASVDEALRSGLCDGAVAICYDSLTAELLRTIEYAAVPLIVLTSDAQAVPDPERSNVSAMSVDESRVVTEALRFLEDTGAQRIAYLGTPNDSLRFRAYRSWAEGRYARVVDTDGYEIFHGFDAALHLFDEEVTENPDGLFCASDRLAIGALMGANVRGIAVPDDLSVVGTGASLEGAQFRPALTTIGLSDESIDTTVAHLWRRLSDADTESAAILSGQHWQIIARETTRTSSFTTSERKSTQ